MSQQGQIRGLHLFVGDIRNCKNPEQEQKRIDKELAKIRKAFSQKQVDGYSLKKYMWKIMYMFMLGYDVEFGHMQAIELLSSPKYSEKQVGYVALSILLISHQELLRLCIQSIKKDLASPNEVFQCLALASVANVGGTEFAESLTPDVLRLLTATNSRNQVRKKAALCALRLFRQDAEVIPVDHAPQLIALLEQRNIGVLTSSCSLLLGIVSYSTEGYDDLPAKVVALLSKYVLTRECPKDYLYYRTPCPWLQVKLLRLLQYFPPSTDKETPGRLAEILEKVLSRTEVTKSVNKNNADHSVLFEAVNTIIHLNLAGSHMLHTKAISLLSRFVAVREPNIRYLGLDTMSRVAAIPGTKPSIRLHLQTIRYSLTDDDISIRKRALNLMYSTCDKTNSKEIVTDLIKYLQTAEFHIREELVLKIAILAERYATEISWYLDVILELIVVAGDDVTEDIWFRAVQIVTNHEELQPYACRKVLDALQQKSAHETLVKVGGYIIGEFGHQIDVDAEVQFEALHRHWAVAQPQTKALLLSAFMKMVNANEQLKPRVSKLFDEVRVVLDSELQQRAVEYAAMVSHADDEFVSSIWETMPDFPERQSSLLRRIKKRIDQATDKDAFAKGAHAGEGGEDGEDEHGSESDSGSEYSSSEEEQGETASAPVAPTAELSASTSAAAAQSQADLLSMLGGGGQINAKTGHAQGQGGRPQTDNLLDLAFADLGPGDSSDPKQDLSTLPRLDTTTSGVVYETDNLQLGIKMQVTQSVCKLILYYGNKTDVPLEQLQCSVVDAGGCEMLLKPHGALTVAGKKQEPQFCRIVCNHPYSQHIKVSLTWNLGRDPHSVDLVLPVLITRFATPLAYPNMEAFKAAWNNPANRFQAQEAFQCLGGVGAAQIHDKLASGLGFHVYSRIDQPQGAIIGASATFHTSTKSKDGSFMTFETLVQFIVREDGRARITARASHQLVANSFLSALRTVFGGVQQV